MELFAPLSSASLSSWVLPVVAVVIILLGIIGAVIAGRFSGGNTTLLGFMAGVIVGMFTVGLPVGYASDVKATEYRNQVVAQVQEHYGIDFDRQVVLNVLNSPQNTSIRQFTGRIDGQPQEMGMSLSGEYLDVFTKKNENYVPLSPTS